MHEDDCHTIMEKYYKFKSNGCFYYLCPSCKTVESCLYDDFYRKHVNHLESFKVAKKLVFISSINKADKQQNNEQEITRMNQADYANPISIPKSPTSIPANLVSIPVNSRKRKGLLSIKTNAKQSRQYWKMASIMNGNHLELL